MAFSQNWQSELSEKIRKQPIIYLVIEVLVVIMIILLIATNGCSSYKNLLQMSEQNVTNAEDIYESY